MIPLASSEEMMQQIVIDSSSNQTHVECLEKGKSLSRKQELSKTGNDKITKEQKRTTIISHEKRKGVTTITFGSYHFQWYPYMK